MEVESSDSQLDLLRGAPDDLNILIEEAAYPYAQEQDKLANHEAQSIYLTASALAEDHQTQ